MTIDWMAFMTSLHFGTTAALGAERLKSGVGRFGKIYFSPDNVGSVLALATRANPLILEYGYFAILYGITPKCQRPFFCQIRVCAMGTFVS
jgi:hypothetical protein